MYWVYIMSNSWGNVLYIGMTNNIERRVKEHRSGQIKGFTSQYKCYKLVYCEDFQQVEQAIAREKELKGWLRSRKDELIKRANPLLRDLAAGWDI